MRSSLRKSIIIDSDQNRINEANKVKEMNCFQELILPEELISSDNLVKFSAVDLIQGKLLIQTIQFIGQS